VGTQLGIDVLVDCAPGGVERSGQVLGAAVGLRGDVEQVVGVAERSESPARSSRGEPIGEPCGGLELRELPRAHRSVAHPHGEGVGGGRLEDCRLEAPAGGRAQGIGRDDPDVLNGRSCRRPDEHARPRRREALQGGHDLGQSEIAEGSRPGGAAEAQIEALGS
jgi:hypothetical protein